MNKSDGTFASAAPKPKLHEWEIEQREYNRQEDRRGARYAFAKISPEKTAIVVIDMVPFFVEESGFCRGIVPNIKLLASTLRAGGGKVAWVVPANGFINPPLAREFYGDQVFQMFKNSGGEGSIFERIWSGLEPKKHDLFFEKNTYSAFYPGSCELPSMLHSKGIDTVIITGTLTNICCESSARDAFASGFRVIFMADANAARRDQDHNATLHNIYRSFGDVRTTNDIVALITKETSRKPMQ